jgi:NAD(P)-dependent dehydrogenase (short-subunit alcohol dehydrogenase family)
MEQVGKVALVTGAATGLGAAFARALAEDGAAVVILDVDSVGAQRQATALCNAGHRCLALACDVTDPKALAAAVAHAVVTFGGLDILVNNAGLHSGRYNVGFANLGDEQTRLLFNVNLHGVVNCAIAVRPSLAARGGGAIVNISSSASSGCSSAYGVSKLAVRGATVCLAHEFATDKIRVNAIAPGLIGTQSNRDQLSSEMFFRYENELQLIRRPGEVNDVVEALRFLCSSRSAFMTGETLWVTGGVSPSP